MAGLSWLKTYESYKGEEFETIQRSDTFKMGNDNFKTLMYKRITVTTGEQDEPCGRDHIHRHPITHFQEEPEEVAEWCL